jgi:hypothetical protein
MLNILTLLIIKNFKAVQCQMALNITNPLKNANTTKLRCIQLHTTAYFEHSKAQHTFVHK